MTQDLKEVIARALASQAAQRERFILPPPPAYTKSAPLQSPKTRMASANQPGLVFQNDNDDDPLLEDESLSTITISINAPLTILGDSNVTAFDPATTGTALAQSIVDALRTASMSQSGIPMIDENGRPRPIHVNVDAAVKIEGRGNAIGEKAVLGLLRNNQIVAQSLGKTTLATAGMKRTRESGQDGEDVQTAVEGERERKLSKTESECGGSCD
jgi:hypothetical protein